MKNIQCGRPVFERIGIAAPISADPQDILSNLLGISDCIFLIDKSTRNDINRKMKVGNKIREARKKLGLNMKEFARRIGVSYLTLYRVETDGGEFISDHSHKGFELAYQILGKTLFPYGKEDREINEGDLLYFDSSITHSVTALGHAKFLTIYFRK